MIEFDFNCQMTIDDFQFLLRIWLIKLVLSYTLDTGLYYTGIGDCCVQFVGMF